MPEPLTVLTWLWAQPGGRTNYTKDHVLTWRDMVRRHLSMPHRMACVTDLVDELDGIEIIAPPRDFENARISTWGPDKPQCLRRLAMYRPDAASIFGERFVCMDMDVVVSGPLDPLFDRPEDIVLYRGTHRIRPYNGSMLLMTAGARPQVYERFTPEAAEAAGQMYVGSDQAWVSHVLGAGEATWGVDDGVHAFGSSLNGPEHEAVLTFHLGGAKPWDLIRAGGWPWMERHYRRDEQPGRCLVLGYGPDVWADAEAALSQGPVAAVIASPEAASHWPRPVDAVAMNDEQALRLARMMGYPDPVVCGAQERLAA